MSPTEYEKFHLQKLNQVIIQFQNILQKSKHPIAWENFWANLE